MSAATLREFELANPEEHAPAVDAILGANPFVGISTRDVLSSLGQFLRNLAAHPEQFSSRTSGFLNDLMQVAAGTSEIKPEPNDRRFTDPAFNENPFYLRVMQAYLAWRSAMHDLVGLSTETIAGEDWKLPAQERFAVKHQRPTSLGGHEHPKRSGVGFGIRAGAGVLYQRLNERGGLHTHLFLAHARHSMHGSGLRLSGHVHAISSGLARGRQGQSHEEQCAHERDSK